MADITAAVNKFKTAANGEDVRDGFVEAISLVNTDAIAIANKQQEIDTRADDAAESAQAAATTATTKATAAAASATSAASSASAAAGSANSATASAETASAKATEAAASATAAAGSASAAEAAAVRAASYENTVSTEEKATWNAKQDALGYVPENAANKGKTNGYAALDETGKVPAAQLPVMDGHTHANKDILDKITTGTATAYNLDDFVKTSQLAGLGTGDMSKATYDTDSSGIVDNAEKVNGHTVEKDITADAKLTDTVYTHPAYEPEANGLYKITIDATGHVSTATAVVKTDITDLGIPAQDTNTTYDAEITTLTESITGHAGNTNIHVTADKQTEWNKNTTDIAALYGQTGTLGANDAAARREIIDMKIKLDEMNVAEFLNKTGIGFFDLFEDTTQVDTANTTATIASTDATFTGAQALQFNKQTFSGFTDVELAIYDLSRELFTVDVAVNNSATIAMNIIPGSRAAGEKFYYGGSVYTITAVTAS